MTMIPLLRNSLSTDSGFTTGFGRIGYRSCPLCPRCESNPYSQNWGVHSDDNQCIGIKRSKHPDGISSPFETKLSNPKRICSRPNATKVNIDPQARNVIMQLRHPRRAQELITRVSEQPDIVGPFFAPNRKIKDQVLSASRNFQRFLTRRRLALPTGNRALAKI